jgi:hypothetical protein
MPVESQRERRAARQRGSTTIAQQESAQLLPSGTSFVQRTPINPRHLTPRDVLMLQRLVGNHAVSKLVNTSSRAAPIQRAHRVGPANDRYEQEADRVARRIAAPLPQAHGAAPTSPPKIGLAGGPIDGKLARKIDQAKQGGSPVPPRVRGKVEEELGADLSNVRVYTHRRAHEVNHDMGARAATHGSHIFLSEGESPHDISLMAHELTHVVQQGQSNSTDGTVQRLIMPLEDWKKFSAVKGHIRSWKLKAIDKALAKWHANAKDPKKRVQSLSNLKEKILAWQYSKTDKSGNISSRRNQRVMTLLGQVESELSSMPVGERLQANYGVSLDNQAGIGAITESYSDARQDVLGGLEGKDWSDEELEGVEQSLSNYKGMLGPAFRAKGGKKQPITSFSRLKQGIDYDEGTSDYELDTTTFGETFTESKNISMFDAGKNVKDFAQDKSAPTKDELKKGWKGTIEHELSHALVEKKVIGRFVKAMDFWTGRYKAKYDSRDAARTAGVEPPVTEYGATNANEDLAETMMFYFEDETTLSSQYPLRYAFITNYVLPMLS